MIGIRCQAHMNNCAACRNPKCQHECHSNATERQQELSQAKNKGRTRNHRGAYWVADPDAVEDCGTIMRRTA